LKKSYLIIIWFSIIVPGIISAQDTLTKKEIRVQNSSYFLPGRPWTFEFPLWIPGFAGSFAYSDVSIEGEDGVNPEHPIENPPGGAVGEILSRLFTTDWYLKFFSIVRLYLFQKREGNFSEIGLEPSCPAS